MKQEKQSNFRSLTETWKTVEGWPDYEVSSFGRVRSKERMNRGRRFGGHFNTAVALQRQRIS